MSMSQILLLGSLTQAVRIQPPASRINSRMTELSLSNPEDNTIGHLHESANPGQAGGPWLFGNLEGPAVSDGPVFFHLAQIAEQLRNSEDVFVMTNNGSHQCLYIR